MWIAVWILLQHVVHAEENPLERVYSLQRRGQYVEAQEQLDALILEFDTPRIRFEWARNLELQGQYEAALQVYDELYVLRLAGDFGLNIAYRRGLMLSNLGEHSKAIRVLKRLRWRRLDSHDRRGINLALGASELASGNVRRGMMRIEKTLEQLEQPNEWSWLQARARMAICQYLLSLASESPLDASEFLKEQMDKRADWIIKAEKQIQVIIQLQEPEYVLTGLEVFADAMVLFFDELRMLPPPPNFTSAQADIFTEQVSQQASVLADKAIGYYKLAVRFGDGLAWTGQSHSRMIRKIEVLEKELRKL